MAALISGSSLGSDARDHAAHAVRASEWALPALLIAILALMVGAAAWGLGGHHGAPGGIAPDQRLSIVARNVDELKQVCGEGRADALRDHCRDVASFVSRFDECKGECEALVRRQLTPNPTR